MKKLFLALVATVMFSGASFGQEKMTKEEAREKMAQVMVSFTESLKPIYQESKSASYSDFKNSLYPISKPQMTAQANDVLNDAYNYLKNNTSSKAILKSYNGVSLAKVLANESSKKNSERDLDDIFGGDTSPYDPYGSEMKSGCRWFQLNCHFEAVFGVSIWTVAVFLLPLLL